ncbi:MAG: 2,3-bisphosphoglycerate-independent phosphoglycerate mutase, partial [Patescibacteria group bacterium]
MTESNSTPATNPNAGNFKLPRPLILAVIDGWGIAPNWGGNAVTQAKTPFMNMAMKSYPHTTLQASGKGVGLPDQERGNSEVGHLNIGAGQIVHESLPAITAAIEDGSFRTSETLVKAFKRAKETNHAVHIIGLVSNGGIHSHIDHLYVLLDMAKELGVSDVCIHAITDGRDTPPFDAETHIAKLETKIKATGIGRICTISGRYYAMDRDHRWERIEKVYRAMTEGVGQTARSAAGAIAAAYRDGFSDEFIQPTIIQGDGNSFKTLQDGDSVIFFNFRGDRARELTKAIIDPKIESFTRKISLKDIYLVGFTFYQEGLPMEVAFRPRDVFRPLALILSEAGLKQLHIAESEKYAHVTYFFNGGNENPYPGEDRIVVPSPKVPSYDQMPEMSSPKVTQAVIDNIDKYDFIILNYAPPDMVGHTGNLRSAIKACEAVDQGLTAIFMAIQKHGGILMVTADHGNAEQMVNPKTG